jgi:type II secretory pathway pseudopilin PulG
MIKFFRNIRRKLIAQGKTANYLKYAIGEIVLVVIGILIALQINNWNEARKEKRQLKHVLINLSQELKQNSNYFDDVYEAEKNIFLNSAELLFNEHSKNNVSEENDSILGRSFRFACFTPNIKSTRNAYQELMRSDLLNHVTSNTLNDQLKEYYSQIDFLQNYTEQAYQISNDLIADLSEYYTIIPDTNESRKISDFSGAAEDYFSTQYDLKRFRENKSLNPKLYDMIDIHKDRLGGLEIIRNLSNNIQKEIEKELNNH